jgi:NAD(P)-dependent dehydrogenase (short-subunit alcohol dehydrogenase family)
MHGAVSASAADPESELVPEQTVLVTGANSGVGLATALRAAGAGYTVVGTVRDQRKASVLSDAAQEAGVAVTSHILDVTDADGCAEAIEMHRPWALVNNAGFGTVGAIEDVGDTEAREVLETMVLGPMRLARLAVPHMREAGGGRIVNVSSVYGFTSTALSGWYQGAKHALEALSDALRMEVARDGIQVVLVEPGGLDTHIWADNEAVVAAREASRYHHGYERALQLTGAYRRVMGMPEEAAAMIVGSLRARRPRARYLVGRDAWVIAALDRLNVTPVSDRLQRLALGL